MKLERTRLEVVKKGKEYFNKHFPEWVREEKGINDYEEELIFLYILKSVLQEQSILDELEYIDENNYWDDLILGRQDYE